MTEKQTAFPELQSVPPSIAGPVTPIVLPSGGGVVAAHPSRFEQLQAHNPDTAATVASVARELLEGKALKVSTPPAPPGTLDAQVEELIAACGQEVENVREIAQLDAQRREMLAMLGHAERPTAHAEARMCEAVARLLFALALRGEIIKLDVEDAR